MEWDKIPICVSQQSFVIHL